MRHSEALSEWDSPPSPTGIFSFFVGGIVVDKNGNGFVVNMCRHEGDLEEHTHDDGGGVHFGSLDQALLYVEKEVETHMFYMLQNVRELVAWRGENDGC